MRLSKVVARAVFEPQLPVAIATEPRISSEQFSQKGEPTFSPKTVEFVSAHAIFTKKLFFTVHLFHSRAKSYEAPRSFLIKGATERQVLISNERRKISCVRESTHARKEDSLDLRRSCSVRDVGLRCKLEVAGHKGREEVAS